MNQIGLSLEFTDSGCRAAAAQYVYRKHSSFNFVMDRQLLFLLFIEEEGVFVRQSLSPVAFDLQELRFCTGLLLAFSEFLCASAAKEESQVMLCYSC